MASRKPTLLVNVKDGRSGVHPAEHLGIDDSVPGFFHLVRYLNSTSSQVVSVAGERLEFIPNKAPPRAASEGVNYNEGNFPDDFEGDDEFDDDDDDDDDYNDEPEPPNSPKVVAKVVQKKTAAQRTKSIQNKEAVARTDAMSSSAKERRAALQRIVLGTLQPRPVRPVRDGDEESNQGSDNDDDKKMSASSFPPKGSHRNDDTTALAVAHSTNRGTDGQAGTSKKRQIEIRDLLDSATNKKAKARTDGGPSLTSLLALGFDHLEKVYCSFNEFMSNPSSSIGTNANRDNGPYARGTPSIPTCIQPLAAKKKIAPVLAPAEKLAASKGSKGPATSILPRPTKKAHDEWNPFRQNHAARARGGATTPAVSKRGTVTSRGNPATAWSLGVRGRLNRTMSDPRTRGVDTMGNTADDALSVATPIHVLPTLAHFKGGTSSKSAIEVLDDSPWQKSPTSAGKKRSQTD